MIDFQLPGESSAAHKGPSLQALPGALGLRSGRAASGAAATVKCIGRRRHPPAFGRAAPVPAPFARPRPSKACSPLRSSVLLCLSGTSAGRNAVVHHAPSPYYLCDGQEEASASALVTLTLRFRSTLAPRSLHSRSALAPLRLPAAPAGSSKLSPASAATARRTPSATLPTFPPRLAGLAGLQRLAANVPTLQPDQTDKLPAATDRHNLDRQALRLPAAFDK